MQWIQSLLNRKIFHNISLVNPLTHLHWSMLLIETIFTRRTSLLKMLITTFSSWAPTIAKQMAAIISRRCRWTAFLSFSNDNNELHSRGQLPLSIYCIANSFFLHLCDLSLLTWHFKGIPFIYSDGKWLDSKLLVIILL